MAVQSGGRHDRSRIGRQRQSLVVVRMAVGAMMLIHGVTRMSLGTVDDFGGFLGLRGLPLGVALAWLLTAVEILGGALLVLGRFVFPLSLWFAAQLAVGIILVHWPEGWFVVGAGRNGMEYSALLIVCFLAIAWSVREDKRR